MPSRLSKLTTVARRRNPLSGCALQPNVTVASSSAPVHRLVSTRTARLTGSAVDRQKPSSLRHVATSFVRSLMTLLIQNSDGLSLNAYCIMIIGLPYLQLLDLLLSVTVDEVEKVLTQTSAKSSPLDYIPTSLIKLCSPTFSNSSPTLQIYLFTKAVFLHLSPKPL